MSDVEMFKTEIIGLDFFEKQTQCFCSRNIASINETLKTSISRRSQLGHLQNSPPLLAVLRRLLGCYCL